MFILSALPQTITYFMLNLYTSGSLKPPAMNPSLWDYPSSSFNPYNLSGVTSNCFSEFIFYSFQMLFWHRGLLLHTPILLMTIYALFKKLNQNNFPYKLEFFYILITSTCFILLYLTRSNNYSGWA